jgi:hypothetical protein
MTVWFGLLVCALPIDKTCELQNSHFGVWLLWQPFRGCMFVSVIFEIMQCCIWIGQAHWDHFPELLTSLLLVPAANCEIVSVTLSASLLRSHLYIAFCVHFYHLHPFHSWTSPLPLTKHFWLVISRIEEASGLAGCFITQLYHNVASNARGWIQMTFIFHHLLLSLWERACGFLVKHMKLLFQYFSYFYRQIT